MDIIAIMREKGTAYTCAYLHAVQMAFYDIELAIWNNDNGNSEMILSDRALGAASIPIGESIEFDDNWEELSNDGLILVKHISEEYVEIIVVNFQQYM